MSESTLPIWKLDARLREIVRDSTDSEIEVEVQSVRGSLTSELELLGLARSTDGELWTGKVAFAALLGLARLDCVGYIATVSGNATTDSPGMKRTTNPVKQPQLAKRGHTKLPPRRR